MSNSILNFMLAITISDWIAIGVLFIFAIIGLAYGAMKVIIYDLWYGAIIVIATVYYKNLANIVNYAADYNYFLLLISFLALLIILTFLKYLIYKFLKTASSATGNCPLNKFIAYLILSIITIFVSFYITKNIFNCCTNNILFIVINVITIAIIFIMGFITAKLLNIQIITKQPCPLLLYVFSPLYNVLTAKNINNPLNTTLGFFLGLFQGFIVIIILLIIINNVELFNKYYYDSYNNGILAYINNTAIYVENILSKYLIFLNK